jgi:hypothetical protein
MLWHLWNRAFQTISSKLLLILENYHIILAKHEIFSDIKGSANQSKYNVRKDIIKSNFKTS